jgi:molybdopterin converting factor small subunit
MVGAVQDCVHVRLWAAARAAAGVPEVDVEVSGAVTLAWLRDEVVRRFPAGERLSSVLAVCSVLVGEHPVTSSDPASVTVQPSTTVEFLPPFAGG